MTSFSSARVSIGGDIPVIVNIDALRNHLPRRLKDGSSVIVAGQAIPGDQNGGMYVWDDSNASTDDGFTVIKPVGGFAAGRWLLSVGRGAIGPRGVQGDRGSQGLQGQGLADVMAPAGSSLVGYQGRTVASKLSETPSVLDYGAKGDGITDDAPAFQSALDANKYVSVPTGRQYFLGSTVTLKDGQRLYGGGKSAWEPYTGGAFPSIYRSEVIVDGILAFNAQATSSVSIDGISIKSKTGKQSAFASAAGFQNGSRGVDITGSNQFEARNVSFLGLEFAVDANQTAGSPDTQMPSIVDWMASDCATVFRFGNAASSVYTVRDPRIADCVIALHCNRMIDAHYCDGVRVENSRFFQSFGKSIYIRATPFVMMSGVTVFEVSDDSVTLVDCPYPNLTGMQITRSGFYKAAAPYPQRRALVLTNCTDAHVSGIIQQPNGAAVDITGCTDVSINMSIGTPFWLTGNATNASGAVNVLTSVGVNINASFGSNGHYVNVWCDNISGRTISGSVSGDGSTGTVRALKLQQNNAYVWKLTDQTDIGASGVINMDPIRVFIPAGKVLRTRSVEMTSPTVVMRATVSGQGVFWNANLVPADGGGTVALDDKILYNNSTGADGFYTIQPLLFNPSGGTVTVPAGHEARVSLSIGIPTPPQ